MHTDRPVLAVTDGYPTCRDHHPTGTGLATHSEPRSGVRYGAPVSTVHPSQVEGGEHE